MSVRGFFFGIIKICGHLILLMIVGALSTFVTLRLFTSADQVIVPDLMGKDVMEAIQVLNKEGLQLKILPQKRYHEKIPADRIVVQSPPAGSNIKEGRSIEVYLSLGPEKIIVPDLLGQTTRVAAMTLGQVQMQPGKIIYVSSPGAQSDEVLAQFPLPGAAVTGSRTVNLLANGTAPPVDEIYVMPDLIGHSGFRVSEVLRSYGFRVGTPQNIDYPGIAPGTVVKQAPPAGYKITKDTVISLYVSN